ncbi:MAG: glycosyltransferase family 2 protein [Bacteroidetes bacterium]|nr:glycosyltransferase family 2 protein [Bacteroidota bacterium]
MDNNPEISVIIPLFNEEGNINKLYEELKTILAELTVSYELVFIDDGSTDDSWSLIDKLAETDQSIKGIRFARNFGQQHALKAGLDFSKGQAVISMDADLQHPPALIKDLYAKWKEGNDIVHTLRKKTDGLGFFKGLTSKLFAYLMNLISDIKIVEGASDYRLLDRKVVNEIVELNEYYLFLRGIVNWVGFKSASVEYVAPRRYSGKSKLSFGKMMSYAINGITSFTTKPLRMSMFVGAVVSLFAFVYIVYAIIIKYVYLQAVPGWTSILVSVLFLGGIQLLSLGIIGEYIGKVFFEVKKRPQYIISEKKL